MSFWKCAAVALDAGGCGARRRRRPTPSPAAGPPISRLRGCFGNAAQSPLVVTESAVRWSDDACRIGRMYKTGDTVHIQAMCWGDTGEQSIPVSLRPHGGRLPVTWDRGRAATQALPMSEKCAALLACLWTIAYD